MKKIIKIEGMSCGHCTAHVEGTLEAIDGVTAKADLKSKTATVTSAQDIDDGLLMDAIRDAGYTPVSITKQE